MPKETNRIWVYQITERKLSGAVEWPNIFSNMKTQDTMQGLK